MLTRAFSLFARDWWRFAIIILGMSLATAALAIAAFGVLSPLAAQQRDLLLRDGAITPEGIALLALQLGIPIFLLVAAMSAVGFGAVAALTDYRLQGRASSAFAAIIHAGARSGSALGAASLAALLILLTVAAAPLVTIAGVVGLMLRAIAAAIPRSAGLVSKLPPTRLLVILAIPFGLVALFVAQLSLILPVAMLERRGPVAVLRRSAEVVAGRSWRVVGWILAGQGAYWATQIVFMVARAMGAPAEIATSMQLTSQVLFGAIPVIVATVVFRELAGASNPRFAVAAPRLNNSPARTAIATALAVVVVATTLVAVPAPPAAAAGEPTFTLTSTGDESDANSGDAICATEAATCTLRAAFEEISALGMQAQPVRIVTGVTGTLTPTTTLAVSFPVHFTGDGVTIDGSSIADGPILDFRGESGSRTISNLTLRNGPHGAIRYGVWGGDVVFDSMTFISNLKGDANASVLSDTAPSAGRITLRDATFTGNDLPGCAISGNRDIVGLDNVGVDASCPNGLSNRITTTTALAAPSTMVGEAVTLTATVSASTMIGLDGVVEFSSAGNPLGQAPVSAGVAELTLNSMGWGTRSIVATYLGNASFDSSASSSLEHTVSRFSSTVVAEGPATDSTIGDSLDFDVEVSPTTGNAHTPTGTVALYRGADLVGTAALATGLATITIDGQPGGSHNYTLEYSGDDLFEPGASESVPHVVAPSGSSIALHTSPNPSPIGAAVSVVATIDPALSGGPTPTGEVTFTVAGVERVRSLSGGAASLTLTDLGISAGQEIRASYTGDASYLPSSESIQHVVVARETTTVLTVTPAAPTVYGRNVSLVVAVTSPDGPVTTGTVAISDNGEVIHIGEPDATGLVGFQSALLSPGDHNLTATFSGTAVYGSSSDARAHKVTRVATTTSVVSDTTIAVSGQTVTYTARVQAEVGAPIPAGEVTFSGLSTETVTLDDAGYAQVSVENVTWQPGPITPVLGVTFAGTTNFGPSSTMLNQSVSKASVTLSVTPPSTTPALGSAVSVLVRADAVLPGTGFARTGTVRILSGGTQLVSSTVDPTGTSSLSIPAEALVHLGAGSHSLTVIYTSGVDGYDDGVQNLTLVIGPFVPEVVVTATPTTLVHGNDVQFTAVVSALDGVDHVGSVQFYANGEKIGDAEILGEEPGGAWTATIESDALPAGTVSVWGEYVPISDDYASATSATVTVEVEGIATSVTLPADLTLDADEIAAWQVHVTNLESGLTPTGSVEVFLEGVPVGEWALGAGSLANEAVATVAVGPLSLGQHTVRVEYHPTGSFEPSAVQRIAQGNFRPTVTLDLSTSASSVVWGDAVTATVSVTAVDYLDREPTGVITVAGGAGVSCEIPIAGGSCALTWPTAGSVQVTATYPGDGVFDAASESKFVQVQRKVPTIWSNFQTTAPTGSAVSAGDIARLEWVVNGPTAGAAAVALFDASCSNALSGFCEFSIGQGASVRDIRVDFAGDSNWLPASWSRSVTTVACVPISSSVVPHGAGVVKITYPASPTCGNGVGYRAGSNIVVQASASPSGSGSYDWKFARWHTGSADAQSTIVVRAEAPHFIANFDEAYRCVTVQLITVNERGGSGRFSSPTIPNCPVDARGDTAINPGWRIDGALREGRFITGSEIRTLSTPLESETLTYGWRRGTTGTLQSGTAKTVVATANTTLSTVFGPRCYVLDLVTSGPGTLAPAAATNCKEPAGQPGWYAGSAVPLRATATAAVGYVDTFQGPGLVRAADNAGTAATKATVAIVAGRDATTTISASFRQCFSITADVSIPRGTWGRGAVDASIDGNCPIAPGDNSLFDQGTRLSMLATPETYTVAPSLRNFSKPAYLWNEKYSRDIESGFGGWSDPQGEASTDPSRVVTADRDYSLSATFFKYGREGCSYIESPKTSGITVETASEVKNSACPAGMIQNFLGSHYTTYDGAASASVTMKATADQGNPMLGWQVSQVSWRNRPIQGVALGSELVVYPEYFVKTTPVACQSIVPIVALTTADGVVHRSAPPADSDYIMVSPAPDCPYALDAWRIGTTVEVSALADPTGNAFTGWGGAVSGTAFVTDVLLDGATPSVEVEAAYAVTCFDLTIERFGSRATAYPTPNCPGNTGFSSGNTITGSYSGGTLVALNRGTRKADEVWERWRGDIAEGADPKANTTFVMMDADKTVMNDYRAKTTNEKTGDAFESVGDALVVAGEHTAIGMKKLVGVLALGVRELALGQPPVGILSTIIGGVSLIGVVLELAGVDNDITEYLQYAQQTLDWAMSGLTCAAAWSLAGSGGAEDTEGVAGILAGELAGKVADSTAPPPGMSHLDAADALRSYQVLADGTLAETTGMIARAKVGYHRLASAALDGLAVLDGPLAVVGAATTVYDLVENGSGVGWDSSAEDAWTDSSVFGNCLRDSMPSYMR